MERPFASKPAFFLAVQPLMFNVSNEGLRSGFRQATRGAGSVSDLQVKRRLVRSVQTGLIPYRRTATDVVALDPG